MTTSQPPTDPSVTQRVRAIVVPALEASSQATAREVVRQMSPPHWSRHVVDKMSGIAGAFFILVLALRDKIGGTEALVGIASLLGGLEVLNRFGIRVGGAATAASVAMFAIASSAIAWPGAVLAAVLTLAGFSIR
jgi:hypothetical protein